MEYLKKEELSQIIFVAGSTRSGKIILSRILSSLEEFENIRVDHLTEQIAVMNKLGEISDDISITLLRYSIHFMTYDNYIGRNSNFKPTDFTSIWNTPNPRKYFERLYTNINDKSYGDSIQGDKLINSIKKSNLLFHMMIHYELMHVKILLKAFPKCTIYYLRKHPVELIFSWLKKDYGENFYQNPRNSVLTFKYKNYIIPYYAVGWEDEFISLNKTDKIIFMINHIREQSQIEFNKLSLKEKARVKPILFDNLVQNPDKVIEELCSQWDTRITGYTKTVLEQENCPRSIEENERKNKLSEIIKTASKNGLDLLNKMALKFDEMN